jgi:hypothetical protein
MQPNRIENSVHGKKACARGASLSEQRGLQRIKKAASENPTRLLIEIQSGLDAEFFIFTAIAVFLSVTKPCIWDAFAIITLVLIIGCASATDTTIFFIFIGIAISCSVTNPGFRNTFTVVAKELTGVTPCSDAVSAIPVRGFTVENGVADIVTNPRGIGAAAVAVFHGSGGAAIAFIVAVFCAVEVGIAATIAQR